MPVSYADLEVRILEKRDEGYPVEITLDYQQEFSRGYLDPARLPWVLTGDPEKDGEKLFEWLFADKQLQKAWERVRGLQPRRRIRLRIDASAQELHPIPWELLRDPNEGGVPLNLAATTSTPFSRYFAGTWQQGKPILKRPIRVLVAIANPQNLDEYGLDTIEAEAEWSLLREATEGLEVDLVRLQEPCSLSALENALRQGVHILHLVGHGHYDKDRGQAALYLADSEDQVAPVWDAEFAEMLARQLADEDVQREDKLRLVFLASCHTATRSSADAFRGFAPALVSAGVPAVVAMQESVPVDTARTFARVFYERLLSAGCVDVACNEARATLLTLEAPGTVTLPGAAIPVLFMRLPGGMLFGQRGEIVGKPASSFWRVLLRNIKNGQCTPFLGPGVAEGLLPTPSLVAQTLADAFGYPFKDRENLARVAQFAATADNEALRTDVVRALIAGFEKRIDRPFSLPSQEPSLSQALDAANWLKVGEQLVEGEIHHQLADLDLPLYLTTNFDSFMTLALRARGRERARRESVHWREPLSSTASKPHYDLEPPATKEAPVVLHLFGTDEDLLSMVLTEDDHLDYLARISRDYEYLLPTSVQEVLARTTLLFLGYRLEDLDLKVIMRGLLPNFDLKRWRKLHVAVQIEATEMEEDKRSEVIDYFQGYFGESQIDVYWGSTRQFVADLHVQWKEYGDGSS